MGSSVAFGELTSSLWPWTYHGAPLSMAHLLGYILYSLKLLWRLISPSFICLASLSFVWILQTSSFSCHGLYCLAHHWNLKLQVKVVPLWLEASLLPPSFLNHQNHYLEKLKHLLSCWNHRISWPMACVYVILMSMLVNYYYLPPSCWTFIALDVSQLLLLRNIHRSASFDQKRRVLDGSQRLPPTSLQVAASCQKWKALHAFQLLPQTCFLGALSWFLHLHFHDRTPYKIVTAV